MSFCHWLAFKCTEIGHRQLHLRQSVHDLRCILADYFSSGDDFQWWGASSLVLRRDAFNDVGGFSEEWVNDEDNDLTLRIGVAPGFVQITAPATFAYREHAAGFSKDHERLLAGTWTRVRTEREASIREEARGPQNDVELSRHIRPVTFACRLGLIARDGDCNGLRSRGTPPWAE
jgi:hypothetical protein